jgi:hypothetical protein
MFPALPEPLLAAHLVEEARGRAARRRLPGPQRDPRRPLCRAATALAGETAEVPMLPGWDCLPYDRASPSRAVMGARLAAVAALIAAGVVRDGARDTTGAASRSVDGVHACVAVCRRSDRRETLPCCVSALRAVSGLTESVVIPMATGT